MRILRFTILIGLSFPLFAQPPDLDDLSRNLDLSPLTAPTPSPTPEPESLPSRADLHADRGEIPAAAQLPAPTEDPNELLLLTLPAGPRLVVPNPARLDRAWPLLRESITSAQLHFKGPLFVVLHADGNFSVAGSILRDEPRPLPFGADISPQEELPLAGRWATLPEARRDHPDVLATFQLLRNQITARGLKTDSREFYFFPAEDGRVFFALRLIESAPPR
jgi:hypothetical protein